MCVVTLFGVCLLSVLFGSSCFVGALFGFVWFASFGLIVVLIAPLLGCFSWLGSNICDL